MRDMFLTAENLNDGSNMIVIYNGVSYVLSNTENVYWNRVESGYSAVNLTDWTEAGLKYFLNTNKDESSPPFIGYYASFSDKAKSLIDENYTYHLGNVDYVKTTKEIYDEERGEIECNSSIQTESHNNNCNIWYGNKATWNGAISLLYMSDYGYAADSSYWDTSLYSYGDEAISTSWIQQTTKYFDMEWFLSPNSYYNGMLYYGGWGVFETDASRRYYARPVLNLKSTVIIEEGGKGTIENPYKIVE